MKNSIAPFLMLFLLSCKSNDNDVQFKALEQSLVNSNLIIYADNNNIYNEMENKLHDPQTRAKTEIWQPKAGEVKKSATITKDFIDKLKTNLKKDSSNNNSVKKLFEDQGAANQLLQQLINYKKKLIATIKPEEFSDNPYLQKDVFNFINKLKATILLYTEKDTLKSQNLPEGSNSISDYFRNTSELGALTMLSKIQNDALNAENTMLHYFNSMTLSIIHSYNRFSGLVIQNSSYLKAGQVLEISAGIGSFSDAAKPEITIDGKIIPINDDAKAFYKITVNNKPGQYSIPVKISFFMPDGNNRTLTQIVKYTVAE